MRKFSLVLVWLMVAGSMFAMMANIHTDMEMKWKIDQSTVSNSQFGKFVNDKSLFNATMKLGQTTYKLGFKADGVGLDQMNYLIKFSDMFTWGGGLFYKSIAPQFFVANTMWGFGFYFKPADVLWLSLQTGNDGANYLEMIPAILVKPISILSFGVQFDYTMNTNTPMHLGTTLSVKPKPIDFYLETYIGLGTTTSVNLAGWLDVTLGDLHAGTEYILNNVTATNLETIISPYIKTKVGGVAIKPQLDLTVTPTVKWAFDIEFAYDFDPLKLNDEKGEAK